MEEIKKIFANLQANSTKMYLILVNSVLVIFGIWFSNSGLLPFKNLGDFVFFAILSLILAIYRPSWTFALFLGTLALENVNLVPIEIPLALRPYQFFGLVTAASLSIQILTKRLAFPLPRFRWPDALVVCLATSGFISALFSLNKGLGFKQSLVAVSFVMLYFLTRVYMQSFEDSKRVSLFFFSGSFIVVIYAIWQNMTYLNGGNAFEVMPGRPNATFTEPDWLGIFITFILAAILTWLYASNGNKRKNKDAQISNFQFPISKQFSISNFQTIFKKIQINYVINYVILGLVFVSLILTVSRSAWVGAAFVIIGFLKLTLINGSWNVSRWQWRNFSLQGIFIASILAISMLISVGIPLTNFQIFNRAQSTGGLQKITVSCDSIDSLNSEKVILSIRELSQYGCRHINLEEITSEKAQGKNVIEILRPDPTVNIRAEIYRKSISQIKENPIFGIGWGSISEILGKDESGAGLNASNIFLEVWLGSGLLGILSFSVLLLYILIVSSMRFMNKNVDDKTSLVFVILGWFAIVVPNLFNSGIFLGFVWAYLAVAVSLLAGNIEDKKI